MRAPALSAETVLQLALLAGVGLAAWWAWRQVSDAAAGASDAAKRALNAAGELVDKASAAAEEVADAVIVGTNPVNPDNYANRAVTAVGEAVMPANAPGRNADGSWTLGGAVFDLFHWGWAANLTGPTPQPIGLQLWGREARSMTPIIDPNSNEVTAPAYGEQLANLGAP